MNYRGGQGGMQQVIPGGPLGKAKYALSLGRPDEAERIARKRLEKEGGDVGARVVLAQALLQQGQAREAAMEARRAIRAQNTNVDAHLVLSAAAMQTMGPMGQFRKVPEEALTAARRAVELAPRAAKTHVQLAEVLAANRDMAGARAEAETATKLEPRQAAGHLVRAVVLYTDKDPAGALDAANAALRNDKTLTQAEFIKANALIDLKQYDEALGALDVVDRNNGAMIGANNTRALRARVYYKQRKFGRSYRTFRELQAANPRFRWAAPVIAAVSMVTVGQFGQNAPIAVFILLSVLAVLLLFGLHFIPVVGGWIVAVLVLGLIGVFAFGALRQSQGQILGRAPGGTIGSLALAGIAFLAMFVLVLFIASRLVAHWTFDENALLIGGGLGLLFSALILYLFARFDRPTAAA
jgi:tetratricopeptide (TPR) repeat protein